MHFRDFPSRLNVAWQERKDTQEIAVVDVCILLGENHEARRLQQYHQPCGAVQLTGMNSVRPDFRRMSNPARAWTLDALAA
jgi:hypothetical protein